MASVLNKSLSQPAQVQPTDAGPLIFEDTTLAVCGQFIRRWRAAAQGYVLEEIDGQRSGGTGPSLAGACVSHLVFSFSKVAESGTGHLKFLHMKLSLLCEPVELPRETGSFIFIVLIFFPRR